MVGLEVGFGLGYRNGRVRVRFGVKVRFRGSVRFQVSIGLGLR
jgi:hypothetical protein